VIALSVAADALLLVLYLAVLLGWVRILRKAGYSPWWVLVGFVPLVNIVFLVIFAFAEWPRVRQLEVARRRAGKGSE